MGKKWQIAGKAAHNDIVTDLLSFRGVKTKKDQDAFLHPVSPVSLQCADVGIEKDQLQTAIKRITEAVKNKESIVVYADYDADGITAGAILWETLWKMGARVMPYIPHRVDEGYGLSVKGIDAVEKQYDPSLLITVDHGITAHENVEYAKKIGIDVIVTDHHVKPPHVPDCTLVHTTQLSGSGVSWFLAKELVSNENTMDLLALAALGTIADLVPLTGPNRSIALYGMAAMKKTRRVGLNALMRDAGLSKESLETYMISHMLAPRLNAMGRLEHALDALRLLCTTDAAKATLLAQKLGLTNKERQQMTEESVVHAHTLLPEKRGKLLFISHESYNQGIIGLIAGKLTEEYYRPAIVVSVGTDVSKASARSIVGFNIIEAIRTCSDLLVDAGGHPMAAGFTVETKNLSLLQEKLAAYAEEKITEDLLTRVLTVDMELPVVSITKQLWKKIQDMAPFGIGNPEPVFASFGVPVDSVRIIGATKKHLKLRLGGLDAIAFQMAELADTVTPGTLVDVAYAIDMNEWNGKRTLQLKVKDIVPSHSSS